MSMTINVTGRIGKDAEVKATPQGVIIIESSLASNEYNSKEKKNETTWIKLTMFGKRYEELAKYLTKGKLISVVGKQQVRGYQDKQGNSRVEINVIVHDIELHNTGERSDNGENKEATQDTDAIEQPKKTSAPRPQAQVTNISSAKKPMTAVAGVNIEGLPKATESFNDDQIDESDIPF